MWRKMQNICIFATKLFIFRVMRRRYFSHLSPLTLTSKSPLTSKKTPLPRVRKMRCRLFYIQKQRKDKI